ncbi:MAG: HAMP domain-containing histidine kinase [Lachnospiraceae bacterium]|nr:HAMP domain-containing histidine kinase [Lachnospiraceae bacterium]
MLRSLFSKFVLGYLLFGVIGFLAVMVFSNTFIWDNVVRTEATELYRQAAEISAQLSDSSGEAQTALAGRLGTLSRVLNERTLLMGADGRVLYDSVTIHTGRTIDAFDPLEWSAGYRLDHFYGTFPEEQLSVCLPVVSGPSRSGYLLVMKPAGALRSRFNEIVNGAYFVFFLVYGLSLLLLFLFRRIVTRPLHQITQGSERYARGELDTPIGLDRDDEMGRLAKTLDLMAQKVDELDASQHRFVANVSHDFRSPLTNISGFLEAMLDGTIPPEGHERYLRILKSETERLTGLTQNLLNLHAASDRTGYYLNVTVFDINAVIKAVCESFEGACEERRLSFDLTFDAKERPVSADLGKVQQVLYNLIDNAIKFSPQGETILIETYEEGEKVFVSVRDNGIGIPKESLPRIWERFYKTDASRGRDKKGSGLGLAIVKEIIDAHGEQIDCISTEGAGSKFTFTLPAGE